MNQSKAIKQLQKGMKANGKEVPDKNSAGEIVAELNHANTLRRKIHKLERNADMYAEQIGESIYKLELSEGRLSALLQPYGAIITHPTYLVTISCTDGYGNLTNLQIDC